MKVPLLCLRSPHHNRILILIRPEPWLFADKLQLVRAPSEDSFRRANFILRSSAGCCPAWQECCSAQHVGWPRGSCILPQGGSCCLASKAASTAPWVCRQTFYRWLLPQLGPWWLPSPHPVRWPPNTWSLLLCQKTTSFLAGLQSTWYVGVLKLKTISITALCLVSIWVERQQRSSPLLIRKIIKTLDKAWQLTNTGQSTAGTTVPMGTGKYRAQENENCLN